MDLGKPEKRLNIQRETERLPVEAPDEPAPAPDSADA